MKLFQITTRIRMRLSVFLTLICLVISCDEENSKPRDLNSADILLSFEPLDILNDALVKVNVADEFEIYSVSVTINNGSAMGYLEPPYEFYLDGSEYEDGQHTMIIEVVTTNESFASKTIAFRTDHSGPQVTSFGISENQVICDPITINPLIIDEVTSVSNVRFFVNDVLKSEVQQSSNFQFDINPNDYSIGVVELKFEMEDELGNISSDSTNVLIGSELIKVQLPDDFVRLASEKLYIMLSDAQGNYIDSQVYNNQAEVIEFCAAFDSEDEEYMLTFFEVFQDSIYNVFCYSNLSRNKVGDEIVLKPRPLSNSATLVDLITDHLDLPGLINAHGQGYSLVNIDLSLKGHVTTSYAHGLGSSKVFVKAFSGQSLENNYQWAFIDNIQNLSGFQQSDFSNSNVVTNTITFGQPAANQMLRIYAFENHELMNVISGHDVFKSSLIYSGNLNYQYSFADVFDNYLYSLKVDNYYKEGLGLPSNSIAKPELSIQFSLVGNEINFQGLDDFEVGKVRIENETLSGVPISTNNPSVVLEFIFDGSSSQVIIPQVPEGIFEANLHEIFNDAQFYAIQAIAENYSSFDNYGDYLSNVFVNSTPYYLNSNSRERVFESNVSTHILPVWEYPYFTRF